MPLHHVKALSAVPLYVILDGYNIISRFCNAKQTDTATVDYVTIAASAHGRTYCRKNRPALTARVKHGAVLCRRFYTASFRSQPLCISLLYTILFDL